MLIRVLVKQEANLYAPMRASMNDRDGDTNLVIICGSREGWIEE